MTRWFSWLQAAPLALVLAAFLLVPLAMLVIVSFYDYDSFSLIPDFVLTNYREVFASRVTWQTYLKTVYFAGITWAVTLGLGFWLAPISWPSWCRTRRCAWCCSCCARCPSGPPT
ncbi:hypothetical protein [Pseudoroseomonas cervicalis]|uniref:hypothetical protein n=1 Tax=Teichococcus cervicalis TaxID=204525 RepID=UPI0027840572|nr:hypothetical protein [Pseudoroseomonas cervicalis]MDQ1079920.1 ABC-type spermidine/putrescine transport system permease subunit I [Pseudoroseomonas cervicalis]